jgi:hypothetical protein
VEVFIGYTLRSDIRELAVTLDAWDKIDDMEPVAIECPRMKFELIRRVTAENMASGDYIVGDLGCIPTEDVVEAAKSLYEGKTGMIGKHGVRICRKSVITGWPMKATDSYDAEHVMAYELKGYKVIEWPKALYRRMNAS